jgi:hypothetical protein
MTCSSIPVKLAHMNLTTAAAILERTKMWRKLI